MARLTLNGMYEYEPTLFDGMILPEGYDREALFFEIMQRSGQLYPYHQQPAILKSAIRLWFARNYLNFDRTMEALQAEYNPIENYDRYEDWTRTPDLTDEDTKTGSDTLDHTGDDTLDRSGDDTLSHTGDDTLDRSGDDTLSHTGDDTLDRSGDDTLDRSGDDTLSHTGDDTLKHSDKDTLTHDYTDASPYTEKMIRGAGPHTTEEQVSAYDNASYQPSKKTIEDWGAQPADRTDEKQIGGKYKEETSFGKQEKTTYNSDQKTTYDSQEKTTYNSDQKTTYDSQEKTTYDSQEKTTYGSTVTGRHTGTETYTAHMHGNIGVTSSQQMQQMSIDLYKYDIYVDIAARFEHEFLVQVY